MEKQTIIAAGENMELVLLNAPSQDLHFIQEAGSHLRLHILNLYAAIGQLTPGEPVTNRILVEQQGEGCMTEIYGLACLKGTEQVITATHVHHNVGGGESKQLIKFVLDENAKGEFFGELKIAPNAQKTEAHQTNRNLLKAFVMRYQGVEYANVQMQTLKKKAAEKLNVFRDSKTKESLFRLFDYAIYRLH